MQIFMTSYIYLYTWEDRYIYRDQVSTSRIAGTHPKGEPLWETAAYQQKMDTTCSVWSPYNEACRTEPPLNCGRSSWRRKVPKWRTQLKIKQHRTLQNLLASATRAVPAGPFASKPGAWSSHHLEIVFLSFGPLPDHTVGTPLFCMVFLQVASHTSSSWREEEYWDANMLEDLLILFFPPFLGAEPRDTVGFGQPSIWQRAWRPWTVKYFQ